MPVAGCHKSRGKYIVTGGDHMRKYYAIVLALFLLFALPTNAMAAMDESGSETENFRFFDLEKDDLNDQFQLMINNFESFGLGNRNSLQENDFEGYAINVQEIFNQSYGDLSNRLRLEETQIPEDILTGRFMAQGIALRDELFKDIKVSEIYQTVASRMDIASVWDKASTGLPSAESLFTNNFQNDAISKSNRAYSSDQDYLAGIRNGSLDLFTKSGQTLSKSSKESFWSAVDQVQEIIGAENDENANKIFDAMK